MPPNVSTMDLFRSEMGYTELEKRRMFLRSYQFSRKQSFSERIKNSLFKVKRVFWVRFRSVRKLRKSLWLKIKNGLVFTARRRRVLIRFNRNCKYNRFSGVSCRDQSCLW